MKFKKLKLGLFAISAVISISSYQHFADGKSVNDMILEDIDAYGACSGEMVQTGCMYDEIITYVCTGYFGSCEVKLSSNYLSTVCDGKKTGGKSWLVVHNGAND